MLFSTWVYLLSICHIHGGGNEHRLFNIIIYMYIYIYTYIFIKWLQETFWTMMMIFLVCVYHPDKLKRKKESHLMKLNNQLQLVNYNSCCEQDFDFEQFHVQNLWSLWRCCDGRGSKSEREKRWTVHDAVIQHINSPERRAAVALQVRLPVCLSVRPSCSLFLLFSVQVHSGIKCHGNTVFIISDQRVDI